MRIRRRPPGLIHHPAIKGNILALGLNRNMGRHVEPVLASLFATGALRWAGAVCWTGTAIAFQPTLSRYRRSPAWGLLLPVIGLFYLMATISSAVRFYQGRGGQWKNRNYPAHG